MERPSKETGKNRRLPLHPIVSSSFILLPLGFGGLEPLIVLCFGDALLSGERRTLAESCALAKWKNRTGDTNFLREKIPPDAERAISCYQQIQVLEIDALSC